MECPACHTGNSSGQKFCGACGHKLEKPCPHCSANNPPEYKFCGGCGYNLAVSGSLALMRSGLIAEIDQKAASLLGTQKEEMSGKPFSLYVAREDLPVFFSRWNELISTGETQSVELALKHDNGRKVYVAAQCALESSSNQQFDLVHISLNDVSERQLALNQLQYQQDLLHLIFSLAENLRTVSRRHLESTIADALKKICLFTKADRCFIYCISRAMKRLEIYHQWCQPSCSVSRTKFNTVPLSMIKRSIARLRKEHVFIVEDVSKLLPAQRYELLAWHHADVRAVMCHLICCRGRPIGIIGVARNQSNGCWGDDCVALVKLYGQIFSDLMPAATEENSTDATAKAAQNDNQPFSKSPRNDPDHVPQAVESRRGKDVTSRRQAGNKGGRALPGLDAKPLPDMGKPMFFEKLTDHRTLDQQTVLARDDGLILLTCPYCGFQESVTMAQFEKLGNAIQVQCPCHKRFAAVLEKRRSFRKPVHLDGYFTIAGELGPNDTKAGIWGLMVVRNISKSGLRFYSRQIDLIRPGDDLMVRFNLDNSSKALIHKRVEVISINGNEVGCRFKGADQYDITLGFYFI